MTQWKKSLENDLVAAVSLIGDREEQQDSFGLWADEKACLMVVADGAGGHRGGAQASRIAVDIFSKLWKESRSNLLEAPLSRMEQALMEAHQAIIDETGDGNVAMGGKAAIVVLLLVKGIYYVAHVGDCRMYHFSQGQLLHRLRDDSVLQILIEAGRVASHEAYGHPDQGKLTQALGSSQKIVPHLEHRVWRQGDVFLLCCDGFWKEMHVNEMAMISRNSREDMVKILERYADEAVTRSQGDSDNVTVMAYISRPTGIISRLLGYLRGW